MSKGVVAAAELVGAYVAMAYGNYQLAAALASAALGTEMQARAELKAKRQYNASLRDRYAMARTALGARQLAFGRCRVSGPVFFIVSSDDNQKQLTFCIALAAHEIDAVEKIYFDDQLVSLDANGYVTGLQSHDVFTITAPTQSVTLTKKAISGTITATARYGTNIVPLTVTSASGASVSVSGALSGQSGQLDIYYQPDPDPYAPTSRQSYSDVFTVITGSDTFTTSHLPDVGSVSVTEKATTIDSDDEQILTASVSGSNVTIAGGTAGRTVAIYYQTSSASTNARVRWYLGAPGQTADADLISRFPGTWTTAHKASGVAYLIVDLTYSDDAFSTGVPNVSAVIRGYKCFDPRTGATAWTENPALHARALATDSQGGNLPAAAIDDDAVIDAANVCDLSTTYTLGTTNYVRALYTSAYSFTVDRKPIDGLTDLCQAMGGTWSFADGTLRLFAGAFRAPNPGVLDETWLSDAQAVQIQVGYSRADLVNTISASFADQYQDYRVVPMPRLSPSAYTTADGATLARDIEYAAVPFAGQAQYLSACQLRRMRQGIVVKLSCKMHAWPLERGDVQTVSLDRFGWSGKLFEVLSTTWTPGGTIDLVLQETDASIWNMDASFSTVDPAPNTLLPSPWGLPVPAITAMSSGDAALLRQGDGTVLPRISVSWSAIDDARVSYIEIRYWRLGDSIDSYQQAHAQAGDTQIYLTGVRSGSTYAIIARTVSVVTRSSWSAQVTQLAQGKSQPPDDVIGLHAEIVYGAVFVSWNQPTFHDYGKTELRIGSSWAAGTPLSGSLPTVIRGMYYLWAWPALGTYTIWAANYDRSGNISVTPAAISVTVDARINLHDGMITTVAGVALAGKHTPDAENFRTNVAFLTYTPTQNVSATVTISGAGTVLTSSGWSTSLGPDILGGIYISGTFPPGTPATDCMHPIIPVGPSETGYFTVGGSRTFTLAAGTTYVFKFLACFAGMAGDSVTIDNCEMRLDVLKGV